MPVRSDNRRWGPGGGDMEMEEGTWLCLRWVHRRRGRKECDEQKDDNKGLAEKFVIICSGSIEDLLYVLVAWKRVTQYLSSCKERW